jgi:hypothetical protein
MVPLPILGVNEQPGTTTPETEGTKANVDFLLEY